MTFIPRASWEARPPDMSKIGTRSVSDVTDAIIHYADVIPPEDPAHGTYNPAEPDAAMVRAIQNFHMDTRGWGDIAYNRLISPDGDVFEGRPLGQVPAATFGFNVQSVAYCFLTDGPITDAAKAALVQQLHVDMAPTGHGFQKVGVHSDYDPTACPGPEITAWIHDGLKLAPGTTTPSGGPQTPCSSLPPGPPPAGLPFLAEGSTGPQVADLQGRLAAAGFAPSNSLTAARKWDGIFGPATAGAVAELQHHFGLQVDGRVGRQTWCALGER